VSEGVHQVPLVIGVDGTVFVNVALFDGPDDLQAVLERARHETTAVFVGVALREGELAEVHPRLESAGREAAASIAGKRQRRRRIRKK